MKGAPAVSSYFLSKISGKIIGKTAGRYAILVQKQYISVYTKQKPPKGSYKAPVAGLH